MTSRRVVAAPPEYRYDAEENPELAGLVHQPQSYEDAMTMEQFVQEPYEEEGEIQQVLTEDAYSLLYTADFCSRSYFFAFCVIVLQGGLLLVTLLDLVDMTSNPNESNGVRNRMDIPPGATITVTIAQCFGMLLTVMIMAVEGDIVIGFSQLVEGYDADVKLEMPNATCFRWFVTGILQMLVGVVLLTDSFILAMKSTTVIDVVLNLTALYFVQEVDDIAFQLADMGILSTPVQEDCEKVKNLKQVAPPVFTRRMLIWKRLLLVLLTIGLIVPYAIVVSWQMDGRFLCDTLFIQFGDAYAPEWAYYSGRFDVQGYGWRDRHHNRAKYIDETKTLLLAYCNSENAWTISADDPCTYIFKSSETDTFDVMEVANSQWFYKTEDTGDVEVDWLKIVCIECELNKATDACKANYGKCEKVDSKKQCVCHEDRTGPTCELTTGCNYFAVDERTRESLASIPGASFFVRNEFESLSVHNNSVTMHGRQVYLPYQSCNLLDLTCDQPDNINAFMLFSGRRWVIYSIPQEEQGTFGRAEFIEFLEGTRPSTDPVAALKNITETLTQFSPLFFSAPVNYGGPSYGAEPSAVGWVLAQNYSDYTVISHRPDDEQPVSARLLCSDCRESTGGCQNGGICWNGWCICSEYYSGYVCERAIDCVEYGCFRGLGDCNAVTKICDDCREESYGNLCQYGPNELEDPFFCGKCNSDSCNIETLQCNCSSGCEGEFCDVCVEDMAVGNKTSGGGNETIAPLAATTNATGV